MAEPEPSPAPAPPADPSAAAWPYVLPLAGFLALTSLESQFSTGADGAADPFRYPIAYALKLAGVAVLLVISRAAWRDLRAWPSPADLALAVGLGLAVCAAWVGLDGLYPELTFLGGKRAAFDPAAIPAPGRAAFLAVRMLGLVAIVPVIEELFYRSFLMRWVADPDFTKVPVGKVTAAGLGVTTLIFTLSHPEWLPAALTGLAWGWLVGRSKNVLACVISHAVANLALGVYVLATGHWKFW